MPSSLHLPQFFSCLSCSSVWTPNKGKNAKKILGIAVIVLLVLLNLMETLPLINCSCFWPYRLARHTLQGQTRSHTHYIHVSLDIPAGGICSLLRNYWHSEREYTAGICPWFPRWGLQSSGLAGGTRPQSVDQSTEHPPASTDEWGFGNTGEWTSAQVCTTSLTLLMIGRLGFSLDETLTCASSLDKHSPCSRVNSDGLNPPGSMVMNCRNVWCWQL